jgi:hypothetical protein
LRAYGFYLRPANLAQLWRSRQAAQRRRQIPDRHFLANFTGVIRFEGLQGFLIRRVANPIFGTYWSVVRRMIWW